MSALQQIRTRAVRILCRGALPLATALAGAVLTATVIGGGGATAQPDRAGELRAERMTLVAPDGTPRVVLAGEGEVAGLRGSGLVVLDRDGRTPRLAQGVSEDGEETRLALFDRTGALRLDLGTGRDGRDDGSVSITGLDRRGTPRFELTYDPNAPGEGLSLFRLRDANGQARAVVVTLPDGGVAINLGDREQRLRGQLSLDAEGTPELRLLDEREAVIWRAP